MIFPRPFSSVSEYYWRVQYDISIKELILRDGYCRKTGVSRHIPVDMYRSVST